ncbi:MAG TPA: hypothetical protein VIK38_11620, partial [Coriobacteriia bacterium]
VVLVPGVGRTELVVVDLDSASVVRRVVLRSLVTDIDGDPTSGCVVGAQTGGIGSDADDAISIVDPRDGGVRYVTLPRSDPSQVECIAGRALVLHSWVDGCGFAVSAVDLASGAVTATGHAPDGTGMWADAGGSVWTSVATSSAQVYSLVRIDPVTLESAPARSAGITPSAVADIEDSVAVIGSVQGDAAGLGRVALIGSKDGAVLATGSVDGLPHGAQLVAVVGGSLVIGDWIGESPESDALAVLDSRTLHQVARIRVGSAPCALTGFGDRLLVVDRVEGVLRNVDPRSGTVEWSVDLGARDLLCSKVVVLPRASGATLH